MNTSKVDIFIIEHKPTIQHLSIYSYFKFLGPTSTGIGSLTLVFGFRNYIEKCSFQTGGNNGTNFLLVVVVGNNYTRGRFRV
jgi:hypothetical protein